MRHIHDCTGDDATCACGHRSTSFQPLRTVEDVRDEIHHCADEELEPDVVSLTAELYAMAFKAGQHSVVERAKILNENGTLAQAGDTESSP